MIFRKPRLNHPVPKWDNCEMLRSATTMLAMCAGMHGKKPEFECCELENRDHFKISLGNVFLLVSRSDIQNPDVALESIHNWVESIIFFNGHKPSPVWC